MIVLVKLLLCLLISIAMKAVAAQSFHLSQKWPGDREVFASGPSGGTIVRGSSRFNNELVKSTNPSIVFKKEEGTDADQYMTPRCMGRANRLAASVSREWPGVKLRITEAWEENREHPPNSLHYSGRALDITTSDIDQSKYGRLAQLAANAGFDWVYYEAVTHVHVSCRAAAVCSGHFRCSNGLCIYASRQCDGYNDCGDNSDESNCCTSNDFTCHNGQCVLSTWECDGYEDCSDGSDEGSQCVVATEAPRSGNDESCFPPNALAQMEDGPVAVKDIKLGSNVLAMDSTGALVYSPVIAMLDAQDDNMVSYIVMHTEDHHQLEISLPHLIYTTGYDEKMSTSKIKIPESPVFASRVKKGDLIFVATADGTIKPKRVASVMTKTIKGAYAPLTKEGNIVINDVLVSCYAVVNDYNLAHNSFAPLRYLYDVLPSTVIGGQQAKGISWYPQMLMNLAKIFLDETSFYPIGVKDMANLTVYSE